MYFPTEPFSTWKYKFKQRTNLFQLDSNHNLNVKSIIVIMRSKEDRFLGTKKNYTFKKLVISVTN